MSASPLVSVVVPCFNAGPMLAPCLESCRAQTHPNVEVVVVDNNSTDGSAEVAARYAGGAGHPIRVMACPDPGHAHARNRGYAEVAGAYVQWLDADDALAPDKIACQVAALEADGHADVAYGDWIWRDVQAGAEPVDTPVDERPYDSMLDQMLCNNWRAPNSYLLRRDAAERLRAEGMWDPATPVLADREYFTLAALLGLRFRYVPGGVAIHHRWSDTQVTRSGSRTHRGRVVQAMFERFRARVEAGRTVAPTPAQRMLMSQDWRYYQVRRGWARLARDPSGAPYVLLGGPDRARRLGEVHEIVLRRLLDDAEPGRLERFARSIAIREPRLAPNYPGLLKILAEFRDLGVFEPMPPDDIDEFDTTDEGAADGSHG